MKRKIKVGFDFDGVVAYNPFRIVRPIIAFIKHDVLGIKKLKFWYPHRKWQRIFWIIIHESSVYPAYGINLLKEMVEKRQIEAHLVTARYNFLDNRLYKWLDKYKLRKYFKTINLNTKDEQPHIFKDRLIDKYKLDFFIEDNLDIVNYLRSRNRKNIYWIYNLFDRSYNYPYKFPYLYKALVELKDKLESK